MAFRMNRPIIKGTASHKASIAKAKAEARPVVAQTRTQGDTSLISLSEELGKSRVGKNIDYTQAKPDIKIPKGKKKLSVDSDKAQAAEQYTVSERDLIKNSDGDWVPKQGAKSIKYGDTWDSEEGWKDDGREVYFSPEGKEISKEEADELSRRFDPTTDTDAEKERIAREKIKENLKRIAAESKKIRERDLTGSVADWDNAKFTKEIIGGKMGGKLISGEGVTTQAIGGKAIANYNKQQLARLNTEGVFSEDAGRMVLPEEIVDGKFVSQATEGIVVESRRADRATMGKSDLTPRQIREKKLADKKWNDPRTGQYVKDQMIREGYIPESGAESAALMRDDRIWRTAVKGGVVHQNMRKSGYIPPNER